MIVRPSARWTISSSAVLVTSLARATFSIAEEVIPRLDEFYTMLDDQLFDPTKLAVGNSSLFGELDRVEPELRHFPFQLNVDMSRLASSLLEKKKRYGPMVASVGTAGFSHAQPYAVLQRGATPQPGKLRGHCGCRTPN
jgi:hypothetical protein